MIVQLDHDQLEIRVQAHIYSELGDDRWAEIFDFQERWKRKHPGYPEGKDWNPRADVYAVLGSDVFGVKLETINSKKHTIRERSKPVVLGMSYGLTEYGLSWRLDCEVEEAKDIIRRTFDKVPGMGKYYSITREEVTRDEAVTTMFGLTRHLPFKHLHSDERKWGFKRAFRQGVNAKIQGPASDITLSGIVDFEESHFGLDIISTHAVNYGVYLAAEVHDAGVWDMKTDKLLKRLKQCMMNPSILHDYKIKFRVPLALDEKRGDEWKS